MTNDKMTHNSKRLTDNFFQILFVFLSPNLESHSHGKPRNNSPNR